MNKERDIDKIIVDKLKEGINALPQEEYVAGAWEGFKAVNAAHIKKQRRIRTIRIYRYSSIGVAAMLIIGLFLFTNDNFSVKQSKSLLSSTIGIIKNPVLPVIEPALDLHRPIKKIDIQKRFAKTQGKGALAVAEREALATVEREALATVEREALAVAEREALAEKEALALKEISAVTEREALAVTEREALAVAEREALAVKEASALAQSNKVFESESKKSNKRLRFGVNVSPGFISSSSSSVNTFNYSGGVSMDISVAKNLQISTGVQLEHQNVDARENVGVSQRTPSHIDAVLTNLDIPINITWHFFNDKSRSYYISGGFSSLAYLSEKYTTTSYNHQIRANTIDSSDSDGITTYKIENVETVQTTTGSPSNALDLAGRVNLIFGYEQKLSSKLNLHIEPFMKIPLSGLASEKMSFITGGVTFKISF